MLFDKIVKNNQKRAARERIKIMEYYQRIRDLREEKDKTQTEIAIVLELTNQQAYQRYESGKVAMPIKLMIKLAKYYNVSLDYIAGLTNDKRKYW